MNLFRRSSPLALRAGLLVCVALGCASCKDSPTEPVSTTLLLSPATLTFDALGNSQQLTATVRDQRGNAMSGAITAWTSGDTQVATVTSGGLVTAVGNGTTIVTATSGAATASASVTIQQIAASVALSLGNLTLTSIGDTLRITAAAKDAAGANMPGATITWVTGNAQVATVTPAGLVTAVGNGVATITASAGNATSSASVTVQQVASSLILSASSLSFASIGDTLRITAAVKDAAGANMPGATITWATGNAQVATVTPAGLVTAVGNGTTNVTASSGAASAEALVAVQQIATHLSKVAGDHQAGIAGEGLADTLVVRVLDASEKPIAGVQVAWTPTSGGGEAGPTTSTSDMDGLARTRWVLGSVPGEQSLAASVPALPAIAVVTFTAEGHVPIELGPRQFIAAGGSHTCALTDAGEAYCWGDNNAGMLGSATPSHATTPSRVQTTLRFASITAGRAHTCAITAVGRAYCWGWNANGEGGNGTTTNQSTPTPVAGGLVFKSITAGAYHTCALNGEGRAYCWGANPLGGLGNGSTVSAVRPQGLVGDLRFRSIVAGEFHTCGVADSGDAYCWGDNRWGQLGIGSSTNDPTPQPVRVTGGQRFTDIAAGVTTCALAENGAPYCWGFDFPPTPKAVSNAPPLVSLSVRYLTACGTAYDGGGHCWGSNLSGNLGNGTFDELWANGPVATPVLVTAGLRAVSVGWDHACALTEDNRAVCWGERGYGALGDGYTAFAPSPVVVQSANPWRQITSGYAHRCAVDPNGSGYCWGTNQGSLGDGTFQNRSRPSRVAGGLTFRQLAGSSNFTCGVTTNGLGYCWGQNHRGDLGTGASDSGGWNPQNPRYGLYATPQAVAGGKTFASMVPGVCAMDTEGTAFCWGDNETGRLGTGSFSGPESCGVVPCSATPVAVSGGLHFTTLAGWPSLLTHQCGVVSGGAAYCWGENGSGQLGDGTKSARAAPVSVTGGERFVDVSVGDGNTCGITTEGKAYCWGNDGWGEVGLGAYRGVHITAPAAVVTELDFAALALGAAHACGLTTGGEVYCWGANQGGLLGAGTVDGPSDCFGIPCSRSPVFVGSGYTAISAGAFSTCGIRTTGQAECWGWRRQGELGDGILGDEHTPTFSTTAVRFGPSSWPGLLASQARSSRLRLTLPLFAAARNSGNPAFALWRRSNRCLLRTWETGGPPPTPYKPGRDALREAVSDILGGSRNSSTERGFRCGIGSRLMR